MMMMLPSESFMMAETPIIKYSMMAEPIMVVKPSMMVMAEPSVIDPESSVVAGTIVAMAISSVYAVSVSV